jgi:hypothetical protein
MNHRATPTEATERATADSGARADRRLELLATVLLAAAAVATAWSSYQSARWTNEYRLASGHTNALRSDAVRAQGLAEAETEIDVATFMQWIDAYARRRTELKDFYFKRFRAEFKPAVVAWLATKPLTNPSAPLTPFAMPQYKLAAKAEVERLDAEAEVSSAAVHRYSQRAANYVLAVVLFAVSLFFAGMSTKLSNVRNRQVLLAVGCAVFLGATIWIATSPISVSV